MQYPSNKVFIGGFCFDRFSFGSKLVSVFDTCLFWFFCGFIRFDLLVGFSGQVLRSEFYWMDIASDWVLLDGSRILAVRFQWNIDGCVRLHFTVSIVFWTMCLMFARLFCFNSLLPPPLSVFLSLICWKHFFTSP